MAKEKPLSLNPLKFDDAVRALLGTTVAPSKKPVTKKQSKSKSSSKSAS